MRGDAFQAHGLPPGPIVRTTFSYRGGYEATARLLNWPAPPRAILPRRISWASARSRRFARQDCAVRRTLPLCPMTARPSRSIAGRRSPSLGNRSRQWPRPQSQLFSNPAQAPPTSNSQPSSSFVSPAAARPLSPCSLRESGRRQMLLQQEIDDQGQDDRWKGCRRRDRVVVAEELALKVLDALS